jgi:hypothetical protein
MPPLVAAAAVTAGGALVGGGLAAHGANTSAKLQTDAANRAAELQKQSNDATLAFQEKQAAEDKARYDAAQRANYAQYTNRVKAAQGLGDSIGFHLPDPAPYESSQPTSASGSTGSSASGSAAALKSLLDSGMDPQKAAAQFNQQYGRTTGNEAVYYDPSQHGGVATIGLPDAYLSLEKGGWSLTPRQGGSGAGVAPTRSISGQMAPTLAVPIPTMQPFALRSINAFLR